MKLEEISRFIVNEGIKLGADDVASISYLKKESMVRFSNNQVTVVKNWKLIGADIFIGIDRRIAISSLEEISKGAIKETLKNLIKIAKLSKQNENYTGLPKGPFYYRENETKYEYTSIDYNLIDYVESSINEALLNGAKRVAGTLTAKSIDIFLETSGGASGKDRIKSIEIVVRAFMNDDASGQGISCSKDKKGFDPVKASLEATEIAKLALNPVNVKPNKYDVILGPCVFANLMNEVMASASAFNVDAGLSFFSEKLGSKVANEKFNLIDDPTLPDGLNSRIFDDEGIPTKRTIVIENGILKTYLHNSMSAKKFKTSTTGNAGWIVPTPWNIVVEKGEFSKEELFKTLKNGLYLTNNWYTRFHNYMNGDFSTICRDGAFEVVDGEITQSLKGVRISDNMLRLLKNIYAISKEKYWIKWWEVPIPVLAPFVLIKNVNITTALD
ncbi:MAG: TldD/PmbA family protein [Candidatus Bathyarchaeia archaeon]